MLQAAALDVGNAIGIVCQHQGGVHAAVEDLRLGGLHEADTGDTADLALIPVLGVIDLHGFPLGVVGQVIGHVGMDDGHKAVADLFRVLGLQGADGLLDVIHLQVVRQRVAGRYAARIDDVGAAVQYLSGDGVQRCAGLGAQQLGSLHQVVVDGGQQQHIGQGDVTTVLRHSGLDGGHSKALAVRRDTLRQRSQHLGQGAVLAELDGLAAVLGDGVLLAELVMDQLGNSVIDEIIAVIGLHLVRQRAGAGGLGVGRACKQLQVKRKGHHLKKLLHVVLLLS